MCQRIVLIFAVVILGACVNKNGFQGLLDNNIGARAVLANISAGTCSQTDVQNAINSANTGDTVSVPAGSCDWSGLSIPSSKGITLAGGSGGGTTTINGSAAVAVNSNATAGTRITGFTFTGTGTSNDGDISINGAKTSAPYRIDHNIFTNSGQSIFIVVWGNGTGLIDHNTMMAGGASETIHNGAMGPSDGSSWTDDVTPGSPNMVYIEDNIFKNTDTTYIYSAIESYYGARNVFRHNSLTFAQVDQHGTAGMIGARWWEFYENTFYPNSLNDCCYAALRGGSGVFFNNHVVGSPEWGSAYVTLYEEDSGYPALYQVGRGINQGYSPAYLWGNDSAMTINSGSSNVVQGRDFFVSASQPSTMIRYQLSSDNSSTTYSYKPFTYPYPLQANGMPNPNGPNSTPTPNPTPNPTQSPTATPALTPTPSPNSAPSTITMGQTNILTDADNGNGNLLVAQPATLGMSATLQSLSFYVTGAAGQLVLGVYDSSGPNGGPGKLLAQTAAFTPVVGWNTRSVMAQVVLPAGNYFLTYLPSSDSLSFVKSPGGNSFFGSDPFGPMPGSFVSSPSTTTSQWSFYATLSKSTVSPTPNPTPISTPTPRSSPSPTLLITPKFVRSTFNAPQAPESQVSASLSQNAGDLNIVVIGWNDTSSMVSSVSDSLGNSYSMAGSVVRGAGLSQAIYYAKGIKAGSNTVTVKFNQGALYVDLRILEYSGVSTLDKVSSLGGSGSQASSGPITTTSAQELLVSAGTTSNTFSGAGNGYTSRLITSPDGDIAEDRDVTSVGTYSANAPLNSGNWVMSLVSFY